jgi:hypothetical protein
MTLPTRYVSVKFALTIVLGSIGSLNAALMICRLVGTLVAPFTGRVDWTVGAAVITGGGVSVVKVHT